ncbi:MAG: hypothetical protein P0Y49_04765 [Candidatus Pedobacter colombiensis]|uniref:UPF0758 domain-containing protein n=1 Tax=Candidatus Pedobacter colombiensis TaxID=3121371 RepID=A0AAJ6B817_9SPHI|nr:UPF0758 domain-containing protein [Pedobacter sp.]WEK20449.1 MAG: hypothetical protein P0Y49_04765 [Pedobacter sp.]
MKNNTLATETFSNRNMHYFLDFKVAENNSNYIRITRSDQQPDQSYVRSQVVVFEEDFYFLIQAFASLFKRVIYRGQKEVGVQQLREARLEHLKGIKGMAPELRPREKLLARGAYALSHGELMALLIGSGVSDLNAVELGGQIMASIGDDPGRLAFLDVDRLKLFKGMGVAKSCAVLAAVELSRRMYGF